MCVCADDTVIEADQRTDDDTYVPWYAWNQDTDYNTEDSEVAANVFSGAPATEDPQDRSSSISAEPRVDGSRFPLKKLDETGGDPLYEGSSFSKGQLLSQILAFILHFQINKTALENLLLLLNIAIPGCLPPSKYFLENAIFRNVRTGAMTRHFYCAQCQKYLGEIPDAAKPCECGELFDSEKSLKNGNYFLVGSLEKQLRSLMERHNLWTEIEKSRSHISQDLDMKGEVVTGKECKRYHDFLAAGRNFSLIFNVDGVPVFKSSNNSLWPIICTVNELMFQKKSRFALLSTL